MYFLNSYVAACMMDAYDLVMRDDGGIHFRNAGEIVHDSMYGYRGKFHVLSEENLRSLPMERIEALKLLEMWPVDNDAV